MPIVRVDVPQSLSQEQQLEIRREMHGCIERTWFREHIWVAVRPYASEPDERMVIATVEVRSGRGHDKERAEALFEEAFDVCNRIVGTSRDELIVLCRKFEQEDCISGGDELPPLDTATPDVSGLRRREPQRKAA
jgi:regulator of replication initiation timing